MNNTNFLIENSLTGFQKLLNFKSNLLKVVDQSGKNVEILENILDIYLDISETLADNPHPDASTITDYEARLQEISDKHVIGVMNANAFINSDSEDSIGIEYDIQVVQTDANSWTVLGTKFKDNDAHDIATYQIFPVIRFNRERTEMTLTEEVSEYLVESEDEYSHINLDDDFSYKAFSTILYTNVNSSTLYSLVHTFVDLKQKGTLTVSDFSTKVKEMYGSFNNRIRTIYGILIDAIGNLGNTFAGFINYVRSLLKSLVGVFVRDDKFFFIKDDYVVNSHITLGLSSVISVLGSIVGFITSIFYPIIGAAVAGISFLTGKIVEAIKVNESSDVKLTDNPDFYGYACSISKGWYADTGNILGDIFSDAEVAENGAIEIVTPLFGIIIFNNHTEQGWPCQIFLKPILPKKPNALLSIVKAMAGYNRHPTPMYPTIKTTTVIDYDTTGGIYFSIPRPVNLKGRDILIDIMDYIIDHPDEWEYFYGNTADDNAMAKFGLLLPLYATRLLWRDSYLFNATLNSQNCSRIPVADLGGGITGKRIISVNVDECITDPMSYVTLQEDDSIIAYKFLTLYLIWTAMDNPSEASLNFERIICKTNTRYDWPSVDTSTWDLQYSSKTALTSVYHKENSSWSNLQNNIINGFQSWLTNQFNLQYMADLLIRVYWSSLEKRKFYGILPVECNFNPSILPPKESVSIWARLATTMLTVAAVVVAAVIIKRKIKLSMTKGWIKSISRTQSYYDNYMKTRSNDDFKLYIKSNFKTNIYGRITGMGVYNAMNQWTEANTANNIINSINNGVRGSSIQQEDEVSIKNIITLIKG